MPSTEPIIVVPSINAKNGDNIDVGTTVQISFNKDTIHRAEVTSLFRKSKLSKTVKVGVCFPDDSNRAGEVASTAIQRALTIDEKKERSRWVEAVKQVSNDTWEETDDGGLLKKMKASKKSKRKSKENNSYNPSDSEQEEEPAGMRK